MATVIPQKLEQETKDTKERRKAEGETYQKREANIEEIEKKKVIYIRPPRIIKKEIKKYVRILEKLPDNSPDVGHTATILVALKGEYIEALRVCNKKRRGYI